VNMSSGSIVRRRWLLAARILILALLVAAAGLSGKSASFINVRALVFLLLGGIATSLMSFSGIEMRAAFAHAAGVRGDREEMLISSLFWESVARNFWMLGVLASTLSFVIALGDRTGNLTTITLAMASSLLAVFYGVILAIICYIPHWKLSREFKNQPPQVSGSSETAAPKPIAALSAGNIIGYILFLAIMASMLRKPFLSESWAALQWIGYWPSLLVVLGGTLALVLFVGDGSSGSTVSLSFAITGLLGSLMGFIQALLGFSATSIEEVALGITFILSSCFTALLGILLIGAPMEDRSAKASPTASQSVFGRLAWYAFPLIAFILMILTFILVVTPITIKA
jgi:hypothetical protein